MELGDGADGGLDGGAVVARVERVQKLSVLADERELCGRGACVDAQEGLSAVGLQIPLLHLILVMARPERIVILFGGKERLHAGDLELHLHLVAHLVHQILEQDAVLLLRVEGGAHRGEEVGFLGFNGVLGVELERPHKGSLELCQKVQRAAEEGDMSPDGLALGKTGDRLDDDCLEDGGGKVLLGGALVDQGLDVGLCEHAAARSNRVEGLVVLCVFIQSCRIGLQEGCHLVDERTGAAGTGSVHSLLDVAVVEVDDLGILAAELNGDVGLGGELFDGACLCDDLLHKGDAEVVGQGETAGTGDHGVDGDVADKVVSFHEKTVERLADLRMVALVVPEDELLILVHQRHLDGGGTNINTKGVIF